jgi:hypothetical protein
LVVYPPADLKPEYHASVGVLEWVSRALDQITQTLEASAIVVAVEVSLSGYGVTPRNTNTTNTATAVRE